MLTAFSVGCARLPVYSQGRTSSSGLRGLCGAALGENVSLFVTGVQKAGAGGVILVPDDMSDGREASAFPGVEKSVDAVPAVERNAEGVGLQDAVEVVEGAEDAFRPAVVGDRSTGAVPVADEIRRVGQDEVNALVCDGLEDLGAIAVDDAVFHVVSPFSKLGLLSRQNRRANSTRREKGGQRGGPVGVPEGPDCTGVS